MKEKIVNEEILGNIIARFMQERNLEKLALMVKLLENNTLDIDILGGHRDFKIDKGE